MNASRNIDRDKLDGGGLLFEKLEDGQDRAYVLGIMRQVVSKRNLDKRRRVVAFPDAGESSDVGGE